MNTTPTPSHSPAPSILTNAQTLVERGEPDRALKILVAELKRKSPREGALEFFLQLAKAQRDPEATNLLIEGILADARAEISFPVRVGLSEILLTGSASRTEESRRLLTALFEAALIDDVADWSLLRAPAIERIVRESLLPPGEAFSFAATLLFVPERLGWRDLAIQTVVLAAHEPNADHALIRDAERLLHAAGESRQAYELERTRKQRFSTIKAHAEEPAEPQEPSLAGLSITIAGGHAGFRSMLRDAVAEEGGEVSEIPPKFEAVRRERDVADAMTGADVALVLTSQIAHSTSDQVVRVGKRLGVPVLFAPTTSVSTLLATLSEWRAASRAGI